MVVQTEIDSKFNRDNISSVLQQFDFTCRNYTDAMAIKSELQHSLFHGNYSIDGNYSTVGEKELNYTEAIENVTKTLIDLQTIANIHQDEKVLTMYMCSCV